MIMKLEDLETYAFVKANTNLFTDMQDKYKYIIDKDQKVYTILDYRKILDDMADYLEGYFDYYKSDDKSYGSKVISSTNKFYDSMFTDKRYRHEILLSDMPTVSEDFLEGTKVLQDTIKQVSTHEGELHSMVIMANNQYRRVSKVFKDDMSIWKMLGNMPGYNPTTDIRNKFRDRSTPCMHEKKKGD